MSDISTAVTNILFPPAMIYNSIPDETKEAIKEKVKEGVDFIKEHPEMLGTGNPEVYKPASDVIKKAVDSTVDFVKDMFKFASSHPELLLATATPSVSFVDD